MEESGVLLVLYKYEMIWTQTQLMCIKYSMIIKEYGHRFNFLYQRVDDEKLEEKRYLDHYDVQLWSREELMDKVRVEIKLGSGSDPFI